MPVRPEASAAATLAWLYCASAQQAPFGALLELEREIRASLKDGLDHAVAHARLDYWREECARCARGEASHPLTRTLAAALPGAARASLEPLTGLVDLAAWDLAAAPFASRRELGGYCARWGAAFVGPLATLAALAPASTPVRELGAALAQLRLLLALAPDTRLGRARLPLEELAAAGARPEDLGSPQLPAPLAALVRERHALARAALAAAVAGLGAAAQPPLRGLLVWAALLSHASRRTTALLPVNAASGEDHAPLDGLRAWRAARRAAAGRLRL
jgi:phytoene synthase